MSKSKRSTLRAKGTAVAILSDGRQDFIGLTDIVRYKDAERTDYLISIRPRNRNTIEFLGVWEQFNDPDFNPIEFEGIGKQADLNSFIQRTRMTVGKKRCLENTSDRFYS
jgi:hypothetical protein